MKSRRRTAAWGLIGIGALLLGIARFLDPVGAAPDSGLLDLGPSGTRWLLAVLGGASALAGSWNLMRREAAS